MYQPLIKFHPHPAIFTQVLRIFALDLAACPYIQDSIKKKFLQQVGVSRRISEEIICYMKRQKFMFTKWAGIDITKELNAKISQEVYS